MKSIAKGCINRKQAGININSKFFCHLRTEAWLKKSEEQQKVI